MFKKLLIFILFCLGNSFVGFAQCGVKDTLIPIPDNEKPLGVKLVVDGVLNNDLADPNQGVCKVTLKYEHKERTELTIDLISPSGQIVQLVGPYNPFASPNAGVLRKWDIKFVPCSDPVSPDDLGKSEHFNNNDNWGLFTQFKGTYYPHDYCLESFDKGPVNGTWTFLVYDHEKIYTGNIRGYSIEFCDGTIFDCNQCTSNPGKFNHDTLTYCINDPQKGLDINRIMPSKVPDTTYYDFTYLISKNDVFYSNSDTFDINLFSPGRYKIWGLSYHKNDATKIFSLLSTVNFNKFIDSLFNAGSPFCATLMTEPMVVNIIEPLNIIDIPVSICIGETFTFQDSVLSEIGTYFFESFSGKCDSTYFVHLNVINLDAQIVAPDTMINCADNGYVKISGTGYVAGSGMSFKWLEFPDEINTDIDIGQAGIYHFVLYQGHCTDTAQIKISVANDIPAVTYSVQQIDCCHQFGEIILNVSNVSISDYQWTYGGSSMGINTNMLTTKNAGQYDVKVISTAGCEANLKIYLPVDTLKPILDFNYNDISCFNPETVIKLNTTSDLSQITWIETGETGTEIKVKIPGLYHVAVTGKNCCTNVDSVNVKDFTTKPTIAMSGENLDCLTKEADLEFNTPDNLISAKWTGPDNKTYSGRKIRVVEPGMYILEIQNEYGCWNKDSIEVRQDEDPPDIFIPNFPLFLTCKDDSVKLSFSSSDPIIGVVWNGPGIINSVEISPYAIFEGYYYVAVTGRNHCVAYDTVQVLNDNTVPTVQITNDTINCIDKEVNLSVSYTGNYTFEWLDKNSNVYTGPTVNSPVIGNYSLTVKDLANNCENHFHVEVPVDTNLVRKTVQASSLLDCNHDVVNLYLSDYSGIETVKWYNSSMTSFLDTAKVKDPGKYYVEIFPENKCNYKDSIIVLTGEYINLSSDTILLTCDNPEQKIVLPGVDPSYTFSWEGPNSWSSTSSSPVLKSPGDYFVTVTNGNCTETAIITVFEDKKIPIIDVVYDSIIDCGLDAYATLEGVILNDSIASYSWDGPSLFIQTSLIIFATNPGIYIFSVKGENGCRNSIQIEIKKSNDYPIISLKGDTINCITGIRPLSIECNVIGNYSSIDWKYPDGNTSSGNKNIVSLEGPYICTVTNDKGCETIDTAYVVIDTLGPLISALPPDTLTCLVDSVPIIVTANPPSSKFEWVGPFGFNSQSGSIYAPFGGAYFAEIKSPNGCVTKTVINVPVNRLKPYIYLTGNDINGNDSKTKIVMKTTTNNHTTLWNWPDGTNTYEDSLRTIIPGLYKVTVTDINNGCFSVDSIMINVDSIPSDIVLENYYLPCDSSLIKMHVYSNRPGTVFYWYGPDNFYFEGPTAYTNKSGKYYVFAKGTNGIISKDSLMVFDTHILPEFEAFGNKITCDQKIVNLRATGVHDDKSFSWAGPGGFTSLEREPMVSQPGTYTLNVIGKNNCEDSISVTVDTDTIKPEFIIFTRDSLVCDNNKATLHVENTGISDRIYTFEWNSKNGIIDYGIYSSDPVVIGKGTYKVTVTDVINGCNSNDSISIISYAYDLDSLSISVKNPTCFGYSDGVISIDSVYGGTAPYRFSTDNFYFSNFRTFNSKKAGQYKLYVKDKNGCRVDTTVLMYDGADVQVNIGADSDEIYIGNSVIVDASVIAPNGIDQIKWEPADLIEKMEDPLNVRFTPNTSSFVSAEVIDSNGCKSSDAIWIRVLNKPDIYIPDIFTPDGDGINDYFYIKTKSGVKTILEFKIFDRWGELLYFKSTPGLNVQIDGWDGKYNGSVVNNGVYICFVKLELQNGKIESFYTDLTLIK